VLDLFENLAAHRLDGSFAAILCQIFLKYIEYSCKNLAVTDDKIPRHPAH
jgi:hypothetical protein